MARLRRRGMGRGRKGGVKWINHYSSRQKILIVGDGDFSFSLALAAAFGSGRNIVATSLDSPEALTRKYTKAQSNVLKLKRMGAKVLHGICAKSMKRHSYLETRQFHRIVFNFPHAGFYGSECEMHVISLHKELVKGFFGNARELLQPDGEIHISHKTGHPYDAWNIEQLAWEFSLTLIDKVGFRKQDYPGYNQKRGDGAKPNNLFGIGDSYTFMFRVKPNEVQDNYEQQHYEVQDNYEQQHYEVQDNYEQHHYEVQDNYEQQHYEVQDNYEQQHYEVQDNYKQQHYIASWAYLNFKLKFGLY